MLYYIKYGRPFITTYHSKSTRRWVDDVTFDGIGTYAHYLDEDLYRIWLNEGVWLNGDTDHIDL